jgi:hypothetical protein
MEIQKEQYSGNRKQMHKNTGNIYLYLKGIQVGLISQLIY